MRHCPPRSDTRRTPGPSRPPPSGLSTRASPASLRDAGQSVSANRAWHSRSNPALGDKFAAWVGFDDTNPYPRYCHRLLRPLDRAIEVRGFNDPPSAEIVIGDGVEDARWTLDHIASFRASLRGRRNAPGVGAGDRPAG